MPGRTCLHVVLELEEALAGGVQELGVLAEREARELLADLGVLLAVEPGRVSYGEDDVARGTHSEGGMATTPIS